MTTAFFAAMTHHYVIEISCMDLLAQGVNAIKKEENKPILDSTHIKALEELLSDMKYGSITLIIQDGKIIQIDKTEKLRIRD